MCAQHLILVSGEWGLEIVMGTLQATERAENGMVSDASAIFVVEFELEEPEE